MENWRPSTLAWSFARKTHFESCRRHYFYHRFWGQDPKLRWRLFEMRNITTLTMLRGQVVHNVIAEMLKSHRMGMDADVKTAKQFITQLLRQKYMESAKKLWHIENRPQGRKLSEITNLLEHYYNFPNVEERAREAQQVAWKCIENLFESELWQNILKSSPRYWMEIEEDSFPHFDLDGIQVYTKIDFAHSIETPTIIDWKTGIPAEQDRKQVILYSLYAQSKWEWPSQESKLALVYLQPELKIEEFFATDEEVEAVKEEVRKSFYDMCALEPAYEPANIDDFPPTDNGGNCYWCRFRGVCEYSYRAISGSDTILESSE